MSERVRFHPACILVSFFNGIKNSTILFLYGVFSNELWIMLAIISAILAFTAIIAVVKYFTQTYQITDDQIILYTGILNRKEINIPYDRIQTIKKRQWFFFKPFGLIQLLIETAGGQDGKAEGNFPAVKEDVLNTIEAHRYKTANSITPVDSIAETTDSTLTDSISESSDDSSAAAPEVISQEISYSHMISDSQIVWFSLTDLGIIALLLAFFAFVDDFIPESWFSSLTDYTNELLTHGIWIVLGLGIIALLILSLISIARNFFRYYNFKSSRAGDYLVIEKGLFERSTQTIPVSKIQGITVEQQLLHKLLGLASVELLIAGSQAKENAEGDDATFYLLPIIPEKQLQNVLASLLPEWDLVGSEITYTSRYHLWYFLRWYLLTIPVIGVVAYYYKWIAIIVVVIVLILMLSRWLDCRYQGYALMRQKVLCTQHFTFLTLTQTYTTRNKIQSFTKRTTPWLYRKGIGHFELCLKVGNHPKDIHLEFVSLDIIKHISQFYRVKKEEPITD
ncbi:PH domain-containing protein [Bavariicoccus seileri]|uniref:PH domain-containing protein n=1 Tax=Bavariicoccus seileri TaxID=549685 RepID=UPI0003B3A122|nr:PH domain-containing protein [Bavariicoccus seileri]